MVSDISYSGLHLVKLKGGSKFLSILKPKNLNGGKELALGSSCWGGEGRLIEIPLLQESSGKSYSIN
ncbi:hypothetical protein VNO78_18573 [Psophocarpus tetragonolobus]|uniref:Uncharacterized protein n=1 Tax=Psophocarpus tetragonolobus TaxID=3891 RepID=A0AAN9SJQ2_PSOTE